MNPEYDEEDFVMAPAPVEVRGGYHLEEVVPPDSEPEFPEDTPLTGRWG